MTSIVASPRRLSFRVTQSVAALLKTIIEYKVDPKGLSINKVLRV